jgi:UDP-N-acetylmuramoyl-tripeptide--D-alanyl-D-alanine ligase
MIKKILNTTRAFYSLEFPKTVTYMLQSTEYRVWPYLKWLWEAEDFSKIRNRRELDKTEVAKLILQTIYSGIIIEIAAGIVLIVLSFTGTIYFGWCYGLAVIIAFPVVWSHLICLPVFAARELIIKPKEQKEVLATKRIFAKTKAIKIAVAGSYGKTSMKELLNTVLSEGKKVAATPANKNVATSHYIFAKSLSGKEDIVIVEFGEGGPGDVARFSDTLKPDPAVITGIAPAHLDRYKTLDKAAEDIFSLSNFVPLNKIYVNKESPEAAKRVKEGMVAYDREGALGWQVSNIRSDITGLKFKLSKGNKTFNLSSSLIGRHQIGPISLTAAMAYNLGLTNKQIEEGIRKVKPYEHRMQPYTINGAWIIDDTYNGNLEGIKAGTALLKELDAKRKIYVTPGLVDQGRETGKIHEEVGALIADAAPNTVVLMENSVTKYIVKGLKEAGYQGEIDRRTDPLLYYTNIASFLANGDLVIMQNDWTDNYI